MEELVDSVLAAAHPKLRERCDDQKILSVFDTIGAYDLDGLRAMLTERYDTIEVRLKQDDAAPATFLAQLRNRLEGSDAAGMEAAALPEVRLKRRRSCSENRSHSGAPSRCDFSQTDELELTDIARLLKQTSDTVHYLLCRASQLVPEPMLPAPSRGMHAPHRTSRDYQHDPTEVGLCKDLLAEIQSEREELEAKKTEVQQMHRQLLAEVKEERQKIINGLEDGRQVLDDLVLMSETRATNSLFCASPAPSPEDDF
jgi:hypothetical protein